MTGWGDSGSNPGGFNARPSADRESLGTPLTPHHSDIHAPSPVGEASLEAYEALGAVALGRRLGVTERQARRVIERLRGAQHLPDALRVVKIKVAIGSGAQREALHVLWPKAA